MLQSQALTILKTGANVFLTGEPGSGKTHTINHYIAYLRSCGIEPSITASTGIAATHIGGSTIHAWSGIGIRQDLTAYDLDAIGQNKNIVRRVSNARVLIIDEVSMLSATTLSMVDRVCQEVRRDKQPFGGLQVILVGDFFQLPPIASQPNQAQQSMVKNNPAEFAFHSRAWRALNPVVCYLSEQHRQTDSEFMDFLAAVRSNSVNESHHALLRARYATAPQDGITQLYTHNADVDLINNQELAKLPGEQKLFAMTDRGPEKLVAALKRGCLSPELLALKIDARVMFTKNDVAEHQYANGTIGTVVGFAKGSTYPQVKIANGKIITVEPDEWHIEDGGKVLARITQLPLRLAWAITVHKSQGMSLDAAHMDLSAVFEYGQGYVALSRVRTLNGISIAGLNERALEIHPEIRVKDLEFKAASQEAAEAFAQIPDAQLKTMQINFMLACGGQAGQVKKSKPPKKASTYETTRTMVRQKLSLEKIAAKRNLTVGTIVSHLEQLIAERKLDPHHDLLHLKPNPKRFGVMKKALETIYEKEKKMPLSATRTLLNDEYDFDELRLARLFITVK